MTDAEKARDLDRLLKETGMKDANHLATMFAGLQEAMARYRSLLLQYRITP